MSAPTASIVSFEAVEEVVVMDDEQVVRKYLAYLEDPSVLRDDDAIATAQRAADEASDVVDRLKALSEVERLQDPSAESLHADFIRVVRSWADSEDITSGALMKLGVAPGVLREAGYPVGGSSDARDKTITRRTRAPGVSIEAVRGSVPAEGTFTTKQLQEASGASPGTVRKAMAAMLEDGTILDRGLAADWPGPGRVPTLYERA